MIVLGLAAALLAACGAVAGHTSPLYPKLLFTSCAQTGWSCVNNTDRRWSSISAVTYQCTPPGFKQEYKSRYNNRGGYNENYYDVTRTEFQNYRVALSEWAKLPLTSITIRGCGIIELDMHTVAPTKIHKLTIENTQQLLIKQSNNANSNHPHNIALRNIANIPVLPERFISHDNTTRIEFLNVTIGLIKKNAISVKTHLESFQWKIVNAMEIMARSIAVTMKDSGQTHIFGSNFPELRPATILVKGGEVLIEKSRFAFIQDASIQIMASTFKFKENTVARMRGRIYLISTDVTFLANTFYETETSNITKWTSHNTDTAPEQIAFLFINNYISSSAQGVVPKSYAGEFDVCLSQLEFIESSAHCSNFSTAPGPWLYNQPKNRTIVNYTVCGNICKGQSCFLPPSWSVRSSWAKPLCLAMTPFKRRGNLDSTTMRHERITTNIEHSVEEFLSNMEELQLKLWGNI